MKLRYGKSLRKSDTWIFDLYVFHLLIEFRKQWMTIGWKRKVETGSWWKWERKEWRKKGGGDTKSMSQLLICLTPWSHLGKLKSKSELGRRTFANERPVADAFLYLFATVCPSSDATPLVASLCSFLSVTIVVPSFKLQRELESSKGIISMQCTVRRLRENSLAEWKIKFTRQKAEEEELKKRKPTENK